MNTLKGSAFGLIFLLAVISERAAGATGTISVNPNHLALGPGALGSTTVTWNATGTNAQVYVGDGPNEVLFASGRSGHQAAPWIQAPSYYVFKLYDGTAHQTLLAWTSVNTQFNPATQFGLVYWPPLSTQCGGRPCFGPQTLNNLNWSTQKPIVAADLDHISSLGGGVVRFMIWPQASGFVPPAVVGQHGTFSSDFYEETTNIVELIGMCQQRGLQVLLGFGNNWFDAGDPPWWEIYWGSSNFPIFLDDSRVWIDGFVDAIEGSPYKSSVIYYDYEGEYTKDYPNIGWYIRFMHDFSAVPRGKRSVRILHVDPPPCNPTRPVSDDAADLKAQLNINPPQGGRHLDYVDFHSYPRNNPPTNPNIECSHDYIRALFPDSTVLIGESGAAPSPSPSNNETTQQSTVLNLAQRAQAKRIPYILNWMLWDNTPGSPLGGLALGYSFHAPKDVIGGISSLLGILSNPDMELGTASVPSNWFAGGVGASLSRLYTPSNAATNNYHSRLQINAAGTGWAVNSLTPVKGGEPLYVNGYIRANSTISNVYIAVVEYDAQGVQHRTSGPAFTPGNFGWTWNNYLQRVGSWSVLLRSDTKNVIIQILGTNSGGTGLIDFDGFSAWQRP